MQQGEGQEAAIQQRTVDFARGRPEGLWKCSVCVCTSLWRKSKEMNAHSVRVQYGEIVRISSPCRCAAIFPYKKTVCVQTETEAITLILSSCFTSFHFSAVFLCLSVWVAVSGRMRAWEEGREETVVVAERYSRTIHTICCIKKRKICKKSG